MFEKSVVDRLPPHRPGINHAVRLKESETPMWGPLYSMSRAELVIVEEWLDKNMSRGFIRQSFSPIAAPVLFAKKFDGGLPYGIDYRDINSTIINNRFPLPVIWETLNLLQGARICTKLDVCGAYNLLRVKEGDEHKLTFRTRYGLC